EKLEGLPRHMTALVLQAQACFRTLKIMQPHGHLAPQQALQILLEEMDLIPNLANTHDAQASAEALYYVARMADRCSGALGREISDDLRDALRDYSLETLKDLAQ